MATTGLSCSSKADGGAAEADSAAGAASPTLPTTHRSRAAGSRSRKKTRMEGLWRVADADVQAASRRAVEVSRGGGGKGLSVASGRSSSAQASAVAKRARSGCAEASTPASFSTDDLSRERTSTETESWRTDSGCGCCNRTLRCTSPSTCRRSRQACG